MEEQDGLVMGAEPRLAVAEHAGTLSAQPIACGDDVMDLVAEVVHPAFGVAFKKAAHRRIGAEGFEQLDPRVRQLDKHTTVTPCAGNACGSETWAPSEPR